MEAQSLNNGLLINSAQKLHFVAGRLLYGAVISICRIVPAEYGKMKTTSLTGKAAYDFEK
ncbi:hypothetical protein WQQ_26410 [Hydrocarboniphaga effusa AP103]|uniref:Uncharacterized protein n=1 Tax=Hydrocarboniphaga effusa AP103 TaxID=1172194 RepID=I7ZB29_9GAMM|nr:hypothetical protein WQQ_26410 [Hydrocarboniphaga effusa AP103]